jgi:hypothetical protein
MFLISLVTFLNCGYLEFLDNSFNNLNPFTLSILEYDLPEGLVYVPN